MADFAQTITPNINDSTLVVYFGVIGQGTPLSDWYGDCLAVARNAFGIKNPIGESAWDCYVNHNQFNHDDRSWPVGVYFFVWFSGYGGLGHVAIAYINPSTGVMTIWTSPYTHKARFDHYTDVDKLAKGYGVTYVGWSEDMGGVQVIKGDSMNSQVQTLETERDNVLYPFVNGVCAALGIAVTADSGQAVAAISKLQQTETGLTMERDKTLYPYVNAVSTALGIPDKADQEAAVDAIKNLGGKVSKSVVLAYVNDNLN